VDRRPGLSDFFSRCPPRPQFLHCPGAHDSRESRSDDLTRADCWAGSSVNLLQSPCFLSSPHSMVSYRSPMERGREEAQRRRARRKQKAKVEHQIHRGGAPHPLPAYAAGRVRYSDWLLRGDGGSREKASCFTFCLRSGRGT
jgi:hypothetical protein